MILCDPPARSTIRAVPTWVRRVLFAAVMFHGMVGLAAVAHPDSCADVWVVEYYRSGCCDLSAQTRWTRDGGDCCDYGAFEGQDPGGFASASDVVPAAFVLLPAQAHADPPPTSQLRPDASIPERPPDRAIRTTILLI